ncbi:phospholipase D-like domain-containing protein [Brachybacterium paraconglomeratum]|uniref:phospholipase D-like domain-containing protein n=1 Tax=Brachybacterium paraconglomeratum TaxID=173362 RepID=UPI00249031C7|nr:phospholipase D-like domain-containing protein [Brachybacterium paraconglomeratum]
MGIEQPLIESAAHWLWDAVAQVDGDVVLTSPYLSNDICQEIASAASGSSRSWRLVTTLDASAVAGGYLSIQGLKAMLGAGVEVVHTDRLHAKCFVIGSRAMLGSANLTGAGLGSRPSPNHELGVELDPEQTRHALEVISTWPTRDVDPSDLDRLEKAAKDLTSVSKQRPDGPLDTSSALHLAERLLVDARDPERRLWLKLEYGEPNLDGWRGPSFFASSSKGRPSFRPGDLVFICAKETYDCYAVVEVTAEAEFQPEDFAEMVAIDRPGDLDRWPWVNRTESRLVPDELPGLKLEELRPRGQGLRNGHVRLSFDQFTAGVRALARLAPS